MKGTKAIRQRSLDLSTPLKAGKLGMTAFGNGRHGAPGGSSREFTMSGRALPGHQGSRKMYKLQNEANFVDCGVFGKRLYYKWLEFHVSHFGTWLRFTGLASFWAVWCDRWRGMVGGEMVNDGAAHREVRPPQNEWQAGRLPYKGNDGNGRIPRGRGIPPYNGTKKRRQAGESVTGRAVAALRGGGEGTCPGWAGLSSGPLDLQE
jgi:hypothetical protein